jgi:hypothetical protein
MNKTAPLSYLRLPLRLFLVSGLAFGFILGAAPGVAPAQNAGNVDPGQSVNWAAGAIGHAQQMRRFRDADQGSQLTPPIIPKFEADRDPSGRIATFQPNGATITGNNPFFQNLGTNGRTCFTCHQPQTGWTVSAASVRARFAASGGSDPIFRLVDGATCSTDDVSNLAAKQRAYKLLNDKGLIRIAIPMPAPVQFSVTNVSDPYNCTTNPVARNVTERKAELLEYGFYKMLVSPRAPIARNWSAPPEVDSFRRQFDRLPGAVILELCWAYVAERGVGLRVL